MFALVSDGRTRDNDSCVFVHSVEERSVGASTTWRPVRQNSLTFVIEIIVFLWSSLFAPSVSVLTYSFSIFVFCVRVLQRLTSRLSLTQQQHCNFSWPSS